MSTLRGVWQEGHAAEHLFQTMHGRHESIDLVIGVPSSDVPAHCRSGREYGRRISRGILLKKISFREEGGAEREKSKASRLSP